MLALQNYDMIHSAENKMSKYEDVAHRLLDILAYESNKLAENSKNGHNLATAICLNVKGMHYKKVVLFHIEQ